MNASDPIFRLAGDTGLVIDFGEVIDRGVSARVLALDARIREEKIPGVTETVPSFRSLLLHLDPEIAAIETVREWVAPLLDGLDAAAIPTRRWTFPACYDRNLAPDLDAVAERTGLSADQVIDAHRSITYHVYMIGFLPGFPYLGDLPDVLVLPRLEEPRLRVPAGSISIATALTAIYPVESPGGWHLIGRTPVRLFDPTSATPALLRPGDKITFDPIDPDRFEEILGQVRQGAYLPPCQEEDGS